VAAAAVRRAAIVGEGRGRRAGLRPAGGHPVLARQGGVRRRRRGPRVRGARHLLRRAIVETFRSRLAGLDLRVLQDRFDGGLTVTTGDTVGAQDLLTQLGPVPVLSALLDRLEPDGVGEGPAAVGSRRRWSSSPWRGSTSTAVSPRTPTAPDGLRRLTASVEGALQK